ncbi:hypothetical protein J2W42_005269 [Rhizobium tibeticum]|nr:hypothetical protein [Rhizobium tibeticum]
MTISIEGQIEELRAAFERLDLSQAPGEGL